MVLLCLVLLCFYKQSLMHVHFPVIHICTGTREIRQWQQNNLEGYRHHTASIKPEQSKKCMYNTWGVLQLFMNHYQTCHSAIFLFILATLKISQAPLTKMAGWHGLRRQIPIVWMSCSDGIGHGGCKLCLVSIVADARRFDESTAGQLFSSCGKMTHLEL